jgi:hypothetical protein
MIYYLAAKLIVSTLTNSLKSIIKNVYLWVLKEHSYL